MNLIIFDGKFQIETFNPAAPLRHPRPCTSFGHTAGEVCRRKRSATFVLPMDAIELCHSGALRFQGALTGRRQVGDCSRCSSKRFNRIGGTDELSAGIELRQHRKKKCCQKGRLESEVLTRLRRGRQVHGHHHLALLTSS